MQHVHLRFRQDIQGLRALAVVLVALDHARIGPFTGGYVGVDVFFVISGFLITSLLLGEAAATGRVSLLGFYARRAKRILPAATLVMLVTILASLVVLTPIESRSAIEDAVWATFFAANVKLTRDGTDYFNAEATASPLQHYWSLAVEEQFYLVWPLLVLVLCLVVALVRRRRGEAPTPARAAVPLLLVLIAVSFAWSVYSTPGHSVEAYFSPFTRAWELGLGALLASLAHRVARAPAGLLALASWAGLAAVLTAATGFEETTAFPGYAAALPVLGTALLLAGGLRPAAWGPQGLLSLRPVRSVGDWSYSFYLWHWPALIMAGALWGTPHGWSGGSVLLVSLALAGLTYHYVENPVRRSRLVPLRRRRGLLLYPAVLAVALPLLVGANRIVELQVSGGGEAITTSSFGQSPSDSEVQFRRDEVRNLVKASVLAAENDIEVPAGLQPSLLELTDDKPAVEPCTYFEITADRPLCARGDVEGERSLVLIGDSHARQWIPPIEALSKRYGYTDYFLVREGCPGSDVTPWLSDGSGPSTDCADFQEWARAQVAALQPDIVVIASDANNQGFADDEGQQVTDQSEVAALFKEGIQRQIELVSPHTDRVVVIGDPPALKFSPGYCLAHDDASLGRCSGTGVPRSIAMIKALKRGTRATDAEYIATASWFCFRGTCPTVIGGYIARLDRDHITASYAEHLTDVLEPELRLED